MNYEILNQPDIDIGGKAFPLMFNKLITDNSSSLVISGKAPSTIFKTLKIDFNDDEVVDWLEMWVKQIISPNEKFRDKQLTADVIISGECENKPCRVMLTAIYPVCVNKYDDRPHDVIFNALPRMVDNLRS